MTQRHTGHPAARKPDGRRWRRRGALSLAALSLGAPVLATAAAAPAPDPAWEVYAHPQRLVRLRDGRRMNLHCIGAGAPTVVFEGGWSATTVGWRRVQSEVAAFTRACSYDRAGYGFSDPGPAPRSAGVEADDLRALLRASGERGPYVLVAHSMGGLVTRLFVDRNRRAVAGVVLVDPSNPRQDARMAALSPTAGANDAASKLAFADCAARVIASEAAEPQRLLVCVDKPDPTLPASVNAVRRTSQLTAAHQRTVLSELQSMGAASSAEVERSRRPWGALPVVVLTAERTTEDPRLPAADRVALAKAWWAMHQDAADLSHGGRHRLVAGASHMIPTQRPEAVVEAVREVVAQARAAPASR